MRNGAPGGFWKPIIVRAFLCLLLVLSVEFNGSRALGQEIRVGSKPFPESLILGDIATLLAKSAGADAIHRPGLGGTQVAWAALLKGSIDIYPEYTGTIRKEILGQKDPAQKKDLRKALAEQGIHMTRPLGFSNSYAIGMQREEAERLNIRKISDLKDHPALKIGFTNEFIDRVDGWPGLKRHYQLPQVNVSGLEHALAYRSLETGTIQATDLYTTDAKIRTMNLQVLVDDKAYFPSYEAVLLYREDLEERAPAVVVALRSLEGRIVEGDMIDMNARAELERVPELQVAADFLREAGLISAQDYENVQIESKSNRLLRALWQHLTLVAISLAGAIFCAMPLGILASRKPKIGQILLAGAGILQTIPSIAMLSFLIPLLDIGPRNAIAALFLYSLLPIMRNTYAGLKDIPLSIRESSEALGLPAFARLRLVEFPMAARTILAGIKTAAVINVGTATLGGFIGAGGFGEVIFAGLYKNDRGLILQGAIPTALLALAVQALFELAERKVVPLGLRLEPAR